MRYKIRFVWAITQMMLCNISFSNKTFFVALRPHPNKSIFRQLNKRDNTNHFNSFCRSKHCLDNWFGPFISWLVFIDSVSKQIINNYFFSMWSPHLVFWFFCRPQFDARSVREIFSTCPKPWNNLEQFTAKSGITSTLSFRLLMPVAIVNVMEMNCKLTL